MKKKLVRNRERYDIDAFIKSVLHMQRGQMVLAIDREHRRADATISGRGGPQARLDGVVDYVAGLSRINHFVQSGKLIKGRPETFVTHKVAAALVERGEMKQEDITLID